MRSLKIIRFFARLGRILSRIIGICSVALALLCALCVLGIVFLPNESFEFSGITIGSLVSDSSRINLGQLYTYLTVYIITFSGEAVLCTFSGMYFANVLRTGAPFSGESAAELLRLGILTVLLPLVTMLTASIVGNVMSDCFGGIGELNIGSFLSVGIGLVFILLSLPLRHRAAREDIPLPD